MLASPTDAGRLDGHLRAARPQRTPCARLEPRSRPKAASTATAGSGQLLSRLKDGSADPRSQVSIMNDRIPAPDRRRRRTHMCLAGDNLIVDLDLSEANLPAGSQVGNRLRCHPRNHRSEAHRLLEIRSPLWRRRPHFRQQQATAKQLHLRGRYARIVRGGTIRIGDRWQTCGHLTRLPTLATSAITHLSASPSPSAFHLPLSVPTLPVTPDRACDRAGPGDHWLDHSGFDRLRPGGRRGADPAVGEPDFLAGADVVHFDAAHVAHRVARSASTRCGPKWPSAPAAASSA